MAEVFAIQVRVDQLRAGRKTGILGRPVKMVISTKSREMQKERTTMRKRLKMVIITALDYSNR
jgi:hypothetical protein